MFHITGQVTIRERQLKFTGNCIRMPTVEPANQFVIYESRFRSSLQPEAPMITYLIHLHILIENFWLYKNIRNYTEDKRIHLIKELAGQLTTKV